MTARFHNPEVTKLVGELFSAVQRAQGFAFCSDGETFYSVQKFFERIRGRMGWSIESSRIMRAFLKKHGQLGDHTIFRVHHRKMGGQVHCRVFRKDGALGKCGDLAMSIEEFADFQASAPFMEFVADPGRAVPNHGSGP